MQNNIREGRQIVAEQDRLDTARESARQQVIRFGEAPGTPAARQRYASALHLHSRAIDAADAHRGQLIRFLARHQLTKSDLV
jgi:hypothetical protein